MNSSSIVIPANPTSGVRGNDDRVLYSLFLSGTLCSVPRNHIITEPLEAKGATHSLPLRGENLALLYAAQDGPVRITPQRIKNGNSS